MKKLLSFSLLIAYSLLQADATPQQPANTTPELPSDGDLFKKNKAVTFINAEFLYWTVNEGSLDYALKMNQPAWGPDHVFANGKMKKATFDFDPGFRVSLGWFNAPDYWDLYGQYTFLRSEGHNKVNAPHEANEFLNGTWPQPDLISFPLQHVPLTHAESDIHFQYNVFDFLASRRFNPNLHLCMRLFGGATVAWFKQNWQIEYKDTHNQKSHIHNKWRFTGAGIRLGYMIDWYMHISGLYLTGLASLAVLAGPYHNISKQTTTARPSPSYNTSIPIRNMHFHDTRLATQVQIAAGPSWQQAFDSVRTGIFLGYELNMWSNLHEVYRSTNNTPQGSKETWLSNGFVCLQGLTARFNLDF